MSTGGPRKPAGPGNEAASSTAVALPVDEAVAEEHAAGEIAHHWFEAGNWMRLEAVLTDREMLGAIFAHRSRSEILDWWAALERETGARLEQRCEVAWRRWSLDPENPRERRETRRLAMCLVGLLFDAGRCGDFAERLLRTALGIDAEEHGGDGREVGMHLEMLARLLHARGDQVLAEEVGRRALAIAEKTDGPDSWAACIRFNTLAGVFLAREEYPEAMRLYRRSLAIAQGHVGPHSEDLLAVLENLVNVLVLLGDFEAAEPQARRVLVIAESAAEPDPLAIGRYARGLANVLEGSGHHAAALEPRRRALAIAERELGPGHPITLRARMELAETLGALGQAMEAESLLRRVVELVEADGGDDVPDDLLPTALMILSDHLSRQERYPEAAPFLERVLAMLDDPTDEEEVDPVALTLVLQQLGVACRETGRLEEAERCLVRARAVAEVDGFPQPLLLAKVLSALGQLRAVEARLVEAEELFVACLAILRERLPDGHHDVMDVEGRLVEVRERMNREDMAGQVRAAAGMPRTCETRHRIG